MSPRSPEEIRRDMAETRASIASKLEQLERRVEETVLNSVTSVTGNLQSSLNQITERIGGTVNQVSTNFQTSLTHMGDRVNQSVKQIGSTVDVRRHVRTHPFTAFAVSAVAGALVYSLVNERKRRPRVIHRDYEVEPSAINRSNGHGLIRDILSKTAKETQTTLSSNLGISRSQESLPAQPASSERRSGDWQNMFVTLLSGVIADWAADAIKMLDPKMQDKIKNALRKSSAQLESSSDRHEQAEETRSRFPQRDRDFIYEEEVSESLGRIPEDDWETEVEGKVLNPKTG